MVPRLLHRCWYHLGKPYPARPAEAGACNTWRMREETGRPLRKQLMQHKYIVGYNPTQHYSSKVEDAHQDALTAATY